MPKYDYRCDACEQVEEFHFSIHETLPATIVHLECDGDYHRVFSAVPGHFKGQGWGKVYRKHTPKEIS